MKCECGNDKFYAHQKCRVDIIVDEYNSFLDNLVSDKELGDSVYDSETPYGPYTCTECGKVYDELE
jgi:hypothetical protein